MSRLIFDIETDGFLEKVTTLHCLVVKDIDTSERGVFRNATARDGIALLQECTRMAGHNVIKYDIPVLNKLYPWAKIDAAKAYDTQTMARLAFPDLKETDLRLIARGTLPGKYAGKQSLEAWGYRMGVMKGEYMDWCEKNGIKEPWAIWRQEMEDYCIQDVAVTEALICRINAEKLTPESQALEHGTQVIVARQERYGFAFNLPKALELYSTLLKHKSNLEAALATAPAFKPRYMRDGKTMVPKKDLARLGYTAGAPLTKLKLTEFNPGSRDHVALWLKRGFGWIPTEFTDEGKAKIDDSILVALPWPETKPLAEYFMVTKRLGQLYEGKEAWVKHEKNGRIHGGVNTNGAVTGRMTHMSPNVGQTPAVNVPYGKECRGLFGTPDGKVLVGADADALELRDLAGFMARYDGGAYIKTVLEGRKEEGTDMHSVNCRALGMDPKVKQWDGGTGRDVAKTWFYAFIYGAGDEKLGAIQHGAKGAEAVAAGRAGRASFMRGLPALGQLVTAVHETIYGNKKKGIVGRGYLLGLDGRRLKVRGKHSALNTLLQSAGAIQMKQALIILDTDLQEAGLIPGKDYEFVANVHDEWQIETLPELGERIGLMATEAIRKAGVHFDFACPLAGAYAVGRTWADTH